MRSIPEKTLEHWTSIYLSNRFPNGALWWPVSGEDVLVELPRLAASGPGKSLALELKTTEARGTDHVLEIDTRQLARYVNPPAGPPLPVYYVFPTPHWTGPLTSHSGTAPAAPNGSAAAPPEWWRRRIGRAWFGDWLYVMSARSVAAALPHGWNAPRRKRATLFTLNSSRVVGGKPSWASLLGPTLSSWPIDWTRFWRIVTLGGPYDGVRWRTFVSEGNRPDRVLVLDGAEEREWSVGALLNQPWLEWRPGRPGDADTKVGDRVSIGGNERLLLHIAESALR
ncbi:hypothetical protein [Amycolatopsis sp. GM8]|uniref:hypothetical protein n=1 Tax=Amycolatopsis sp. GM8 TaxID=2896530 RepID=UPI001F254B78|nr:hypothetical protein [Amycolatopsis sp. GM8]